MRVTHPLFLPARVLYERLFEASLFDRRRKRRLAEFGLQDRAESPIAELDCRLTPNCRSPMCLRASLNYDRFFGSLQRQDSSVYRNRDRLVTLMAIDLAQYGNYQRYLGELRKKSYFPRKANRAQKLGYYFEQFQYQNYTPDMRTIRQSDRARALGLPVDRFVLTPKALGMDPVAIEPVAAPECERHWEMWLGVFERSLGYRQGTVTTDQRLVAYARLRRIGNTVKYAEFIGHINCLDAGVMILLHMRLVEWIMMPSNPHTNGVRYITYNTVERGSDGIFFWKRKALFEPRVIHMIEAALPPDFDAQTYLRLNPDIAKAGASPELHYVRHGHMEGRRYRDAMPSAIADATGLSP